MPIERIHSFLVHPAKHEEEQPEISGAQVPQRGQLHSMLSNVFGRAHEECDIEIVFRPNAGGGQQNDCRDLLVQYIADPTIESGRSIASRLQAVSTHRSGLGLLFLMKGGEGQRHQLVISRFPADQGIIAEERARRLSIEFIERVFMKNAQSYKSAFYSSDSLERGFWDGKAVDRQISGPRELSDYWIRDFLASDLRTTGPAGTRRLAVALRTAIRSTSDLGIRHELISAAGLLRRQDGQRRSTSEIVERLGLSQESRAALTEAFPRPDLVNEVFQFDRDEFERNAPYRTVEIDNGGVLVAEDSRFEAIFQQQGLGGNRVRYTTEGRIVNETLRKVK